MTKFRVNARHPHLDMAASPLAGQYRRQHDIRYNKIRMWAAKPETRPAGKLLFAAAPVDALTYARATILKDRYNLSAHEFISEALAVYCDLIARQQGIEHDDPLIAAWINGDETESKD